jgi:integrin alpha 7
VAGTGVVWSVLVQLFYFYAKTNAFNLDTHVPIVKQGRGSNSYFGFSVAQHQIYEYTTGTTQHVFLVGAPKDNVTDPEAPLSVRKLNRPGVIYQCPVTGDPNDCKPLPVFQEPPANGIEDRNDNWFGVSLASQGTPEGSAVACAHRYKWANNASYSWGVGLCVFLTNLLDEGLVQTPCPFELGSNTRKGHYGFCQAGASVALSKDSEDVLYGAPGAINWRGSVFKSINPDSLEPLITYRSPSEDKIKGVTKPDPATMYYSNLGFSTKIGNVINKQKTYLVGAPRSKEIGEVLMFTEGQFPWLNNGAKDRLTGELFGSGFGYDIAVIDLNKDDLDDIVVGCPFYHERLRGGAIYIYMNSEEGITSDTTPLKILSRKMSSTECKNLNCQNAHFGLSVANIGDIDNDGFPDLAVGAPYEGDGAVYIFRGSAGGIVEEYSQRIAASELPTARPLTTFGYSISGGNDMDENGYPDILVGAYESGKVLLMRARPVININAVMQNYPPKIDPKMIRCEKDNKPNICFEVRVCFKFSAEPKNRFTDKLDLNYKIEAELFTGRQVSRITFKQADKDTPHMIEKSIKLFEQDNPQYKCRDHDVYIKKTNKDFLNPIEFRLTYSLKDEGVPTMSPGGDLPDINQYAVLNQATAKKDLPVDFVKNCGADKICHSNLNVRGTFELDTEDEYFIYKVGEVQELRLGIRVQNKNEDAHEAILTVILPPSLSYINVLSPDPDKSYSCNPNNNVITCLVGNPLHENEEALLVIRLDPRDLKPTISQFDVKLQVNTTSTETDTPDDMEFLQVKVIVETDLLVRGSVRQKEVYYGGEIRGESAITTEEQIGSLVIHRYEVKNEGAGKVANSSVFISWPYEVESGYSNGKHLLYILEEPRIEEPGRCFLEEWMVNPLGVELDDNFSLDSFGFKIGAIQTGEEDDNAKKRRKRDIIVKRRMGGIPFEYVTEKGRTLKVVNINCDGKKTAKCFTFQCVIGELLPSQSVSIDIRARLWNSTFLEDYRNVDQVRIQSRAEIKIEESLNIKQTNTKNDIAWAMTKARPDIAVKEQPGVPLWVIILAAIGGLLLLIIIIILLWKCGFFKRNKREEMNKHLYKGKVQKKHKKNYYGDDDFS